MTAIDPDKIREAFELIRHASRPVVHELIDTLERRLLRDEALLAMQERIEQVSLEILGGADIIPFPGHSVKVGEIA